MGWKYKYTFLLSFFLLIVSSGLALDQKKILILNSYHNGLIWTDQTVSTIREEFKKNQISCQIFVEYMDTKRFFSPEYLSHVNQFLHHKYNEDYFDLIISTDDNAYNFLVKNKPNLFGTTPVVFCGINTALNPPPGYTGVFEGTDATATIDIIKSLHPNYSSIVIVSDKSTTGILTTDNIVKRISLKKDSVRYRIIAPATILQLKDQLQHLKQNEIVLFLLYNRDEKGNYYEYTESFTQVAPYCTAPIYCIWNFYLNHGAVGGKLTTAQMQGKIVVEMAVKILTGIPPEKINSRSAPQQLIFDYKQLRHWEIDHNLLPSDAQLINVPYSILRENKQIVILILTIFILLVIVIIFMSLNIRLRHMKALEAQKHLTQLKAHQKTLEIEKAKAEESSRLKSSFLANMSHEIRTPMNSIIGFSELLSQADRSEESKLRYINIIQKNTNFLLRLINDILDISKIETNQLKVVNSSCNLNETLKTLYENYLTLIIQSEKEINLRLKLPKNSQSEEVVTDCIRLGQIITNLIENAIKFTPKGSIEFGYQTLEKEILFFVKDSGIGISKDKEQIIFDRFRQLETDAYTRKFGGTGLGLAICKSLVEIMGGKIWLESIPEKGTTFFFKIPLIKEK